MAQVFGFLREDNATHGEKIVLKRLRENLPKEFSVYVECPLHGKRVHRYPDFVVVTNYGVIILEVKDWIQIRNADRYKAQIFTRGNTTRDVRNPVHQARQIAILLANELNEIKDIYKRKEQMDIPWGYAVVLPNLGTATISQLRMAWGDEFVLNLDDLDPALILSRLKVTLPKDKVRDLKNYELEFIRATINPAVVIEPQDREPIILDNQQEHIVTEPIETEARKADRVEPEAVQAPLITESLVDDAKLEDELPTEVETRISHNTSIRLVRGIAGSGKTLVLGQRARYLAAQYPEWNILVLTFNKALRQHLEIGMKGVTSVVVNHFHALCRRIIGDYRPWKLHDPCDWLEAQNAQYDVINQTGTHFMDEEFRWIKDTGIRDRDHYLKAMRKGRHRQLRKETRNRIFDVFIAYQEYLKQNNLIDWGDVPHIVREGIEEGAIRPPAYDAILIDEAQDFAPAWFQVVNLFLKSDGGIIFLADDPAQSIYRFYSWREKGVEVVGRTRWLKIPYRNTFEIYRAAYELIASDENLMKSLHDEGLIVTPEMESGLMRHGPKPLIQRFASFDDEITYVRGQIDHLLQSGSDSRRIAVLHRHRNGVEKLKSDLRGCDVNIATLHALKGLEFDTVFITQLQETAVKVAQEGKRAAERRLAYMAMTRARQQLYMGYQGRLPKKYHAVLAHVDHIG